MAKLRSLSRVLMIAVSVTIGIAGLAARAEEPSAEVKPDPARGKALAERLCVNCHLVPDQPTGSIPDGVPSFEAIANKPTQTADGIRSILMQPHAPMPDMSLSRLEMDDIIAYLDELRVEKSGPPLTPRGEDSDSLDYPEPT